MHIVCDIILTIMAYFAAGILIYLIKHGSLTGLNISFSISDLFVITIIWSFLIFNDNNPYVYRTKNYRDMFRPAAFLVLKGACGYFIWIFATRGQIPGRLFIVLFLSLDFAALFLLRVLVVQLLQHIRSRGKNCQRILIVGTGPGARRVVDDIRDNPKWGIRIIGLLDIKPVNQLWRYRDIPLIGSVDNLPALIKCNQVDYVVFAVNHKHLGDVNEPLRVCEKSGVVACVLADIFASEIATSQAGEFLFRPAIVYSTVKEKQSEHFIKTAFDRLGAFLALTIAAPVLGILALLIKLTSNGPVFFSQVRVGLNGRRFRLFKFRTMVEHAEKLKKSLANRNEMDGPVFKITDDPRITKFGKFLRKTSLDELPQLFNIFRGEMSFVGPRPPLPDEVKQYDLWQRRKLSVRPGLTCLWQVGRRNDTTFDEWMKLDLEYIDNWSLWMDTKILLRTIPTVLNGTGK
jgi:exopolysaccharide biosynthesis polyprenyl glycosylphosphotransferase